jgi:hypothetical protein
VRDRTSQGSPRCENTQACDSDIIEDAKKRGLRYGIGNVWWRFVKSGIHSAARTISAVSNFLAVRMIHYRGRNLDSLLEIILLSQIVVAYKMKAKSPASPSTPMMAKVVSIARYNK